MGCEKNSARNSRNGFYPGVVIDNGYETRNSSVDEIGERYGGIRITARTMPWL